MSIPALKYARLLVAQHSPDLKYVRLITAPRDVKLPYIRLLAPISRNLYAVATGNWSSTAVWSETSGGSPGAAPPEPWDNVFLDAASGAINVTIDVSDAYCRSFDCTGFTGTFTIGAKNLWVGDGLGGDFKLVTGMTWSSAGGSVRLVSTKSGNLVWSGGKNAIWKFGRASTDVGGAGPGGTWILQDTFVPGSITVYSGTVDFNGQTVSLSALTVTPTAGYAAGLIFGSSTITATNIDLGSAAVTLDAGTSTISNFSTITAYGQTFNVITKTNTGSGTINGTGLTCATLTHASTTSAATLNLGCNITVTGTFTFTSLNGTTGRGQVLSSVLATTRTVTAAVVALTNVDFMDIAGAGAAAPFTGTALGDCLGNSGITFPASVTQYWVGGTGNGYDPAEWATSSGGAAGVGTRTPLPQDDLVFDANSFSAGSQTMTANMARFGRSHDWSAVTNTPTMSGTFSLYGSLTYAASMNNSGTLTFRARSLVTFRTNGKSHTGSLSIVAPNGTVQLADALVLTASLGLLDGTLDLNDKPVSCGALTMAASCQYQRILKYTSSTVTLTGTGTKLSRAAPSTAGALDGPHDFGTGVIRVDNTSASTKNLTCGGGSWPTLLLPAGNAGAININGGGTFVAITMEATGAGLVSVTASITVTGNFTIGAARSIRFTVGTTTTVQGEIDWVGTVGNLVTIDTTLAGSAATISKASGTVACDYLSLKDSTATGGASFYAGSNSTNNGGNTGWSFTDAGTEVALDHNSKYFVAASISAPNLLAQYYTAPASAVEVTAPYQVKAPISLMRQGKYCVPSDGYEVSRQGKYTIGLVRFTIANREFTLPLVAAGGSAVDHPIKGPWSLNIALGSRLFTVDDIRTWFHGTGLVYSWSCEGHAGKFIYRQDLPKPEDHSDD